MTLPFFRPPSWAVTPMPGWLERLKTEYFARRISRHDLDEIHDAAVKAAIKDEEIAGLDIVTDGELRRDNMVDYFVERLPGVQIDRSSKKFYYDFYDGVVQASCPPHPWAWCRISVSCAITRSAKPRFASPVRIA